MRVYYYVCGCIYVFTVFCALLYMWVGVHILMVDMVQLVFLCFIVARHSHNGGIHLRLQVIAYAFAVIVCDAETQQQTTALWLMLPK